MTEAKDWSAMVDDDVDAADRPVLELGARRLWREGDESRVYADPTSHPFCLIPRPGWAPPVARQER